MSTRPVPSLLALIDEFDAFILDQWGVLHDGTTPLPDAMEAVTALLAAGKVIVTLSNTGRRQATTEVVLRRMGFPLDRFRTNVTSGETAFAALSSGEIGGTRLPGRRCYLICRDNDTSVVDGSGVEHVADVAGADFVMLSGIEGERWSVGDYMAELAPAVQRRLPMICSNPDLVALTATGEHIAPGKVAAAYEAATGVTPIFVGKPYRPVYDRCLQALPDVSKARVLCVGDSLTHDIGGGAGAGLKTLFCMAGIHRDGFDLCAPAAANLDALRAVLADHGGPAPDYLIDRLRWS
ncbi:MAG: TIGR01459 family HAD-type hydrolase [Pseudomonadota bacterium]